MANNNDGWEDVPEGDAGWEDVPSDAVPSNGMQDNPNSYVPTLGDFLTKGLMGLGENPGQGADFPLREVPSAGVRSLVMGRSYGQGVANPESVPTFSSIANNPMLQSFLKSKNPELARQIKTAGMGADFATNPFDVLTSSGLIERSPSILGKVLDNVKGMEFSLPKMLGPKAPKASQLDESLAIIKNQQTSIDDALKFKTSLVDDYVASEKARTSASELLAKSEASQKVAKLSEKKRLIADEQAIRTQDELALQASNKLNEAFGADYEAALGGETIPKEDYASKLKSYLENRGVIDGNGELYPGINPNSPEVAVYGLYKKHVTPEGVIDFGVTELPLKQLDQEIKGVMKSHKSGDHALTDLRMEFAPYLKKGNVVRAKYVQDYKARNAIFDTFKPFSRRGPEDVKTGIGIFENLAHEDPSKIFPQNRRMMDFLKKWVGEDPSSSVVSLGQEIKGINESLAQTSFKNKVDLATLVEQMKAKKAKDSIDAATGKMALNEVEKRVSSLKDLTSAKESVIGKRKKVALIGSGMVGSAALGAGVTRLIGSSIDALRE